MVHLFTPNTADKEILADGKAFTEKYLLNRTVGLQIEKLEEQNFSARIHHPAGDIASEILKQGFSKLNQPKTTDFDADYFRSLKEAQLIG